MRYRFTNRISGVGLSMFIAVLLAATTVSGVSAQASPGLYFQTEQGAIKLLNHVYRVGAVSDGNTNFDFVHQGGQELLYFFDRYTAGVNVGGRHDISFLYQPLELTTEVRFKDAVKIDNISFAAGTAMKLTYGFPFYRVTYRYNFINSDRSNFGAGAAIQLRDASIRFAEADGAAGKLVVSQNLGIVPALSVAGRFAIGERGFLGFEATGSYASSSFFNGASFSFEGSILDASIRGGVVLDNGSEVFANARFFGGSASGISSYPSAFWSQSDSKETYNVIAALSLTAGATLRLK
jgi:hypothetical protein